MSDKQEEKDAQALSLFLAAIPIARIRDQLHFRSTASTQAAITRALKRAQSGKDPENARLIEIERLDSLYRGIYPEALRGDQKSVDQCLKISEQRYRLIDSPRKAQEGLLKAYERTVQELRDLQQIRPEDDAVIQSGRMIAAQIDYAAMHGTGMEVTKSLYLMPHLMNVLAELGATPEARRRIKEASKEESHPRVQEDELAAFRRKKFGIS